MPTGRITALAKEIQEQIANLEKYLQSEGLPSPSFAPDFPAKLPLPESISASVQKAVEAADELQSLLIGPLGFILHQLDSTHNLISLQAVNRFKVATMFSIGESISFADVAAKCEVDEESMCRILRHAITNHLFSEPREGYIAHTAISKALVEVPMLHEWVTVACDEMCPPTSKLVDALIKWPGSTEPNETAFNLATGSQESFFQDLSHSPERAENFSKAMALFKLMPGFEPGLITEAALWQSVTGTVVDVGGADGAVAQELAEKFPSMKIIIQDLPNVIENALELKTADLSPQITFQAHDFFTEQPIHGADVYLFRMIFHDWSDKLCTRILQQLIPALKPGAKLLINDFCIPEHGTTSLYQERLARCHDLSMKAMFNGKERTRTEWEALISNTDSRFEMLSLAQAPSSPLALFEIVWRP